MEYSIYHGTTRVGLIGGIPREAWYAARCIVRTLAHDDGVGCETISGNTVQCGVYRAVPTFRADRRLV